MTITLGYRYEKLVAGGGITAVMALVLIFVKPDLINWTMGQTLKVLLGIGILIVDTAVIFGKNKVTLTDDDELELFWTVFFMSFDRTKILKTDVSKMSISKLPSNHYALTLFFNSGRELQLFKELNKKKLTEKIALFSGQTRSTSFFDELETEVSLA